ncbi:hypothetical protein OAO39_03335 [Pirellulaceae bacterium]|nr:hypothetical protein [Pirellulaceae bacterium]
MFYKIIAILTLMFATSVSYAGTSYEVISKVEDKTTSYMVTFGGGRRFKQHTAFDPASKKFVYMQWGRDKEDPKPVAKIWDHETGKITELYQFTDVKNPLPIIPSVNAMKVCPITGSKDFEAIPRIVID